MVKEFILNYLTAFGIGGILLSSFIEALGVPFFPGGIIIIIAGFLVAKGYMAFPAAWFATSFGFVTGSLAAYCLAIKLGDKVFERSGRLLGVTPVRLKQARAYLGSSAAGFVVFGRFIPGISNLTPYIAGVGGLKPAVFFGLTSAFAIVWSALYLSLGMFFEHSWEKLTQRMQPLLLIGSLLGLGVYLLVMARRGKRSS
jgi:membrane protein DedA with SNARE-associated domain